MDWIEQLEILCRDYFSPMQAEDIRPWITSDKPVGPNVEGYWQPPTRYPEHYIELLVHYHSDQRVDALYYDWINNDLYTCCFNDPHRIQTYKQLIRQHKLQRILT